MFLSLSTSIRDAEFSSLINWGLEVLLGARQLRTLFCKSGTQNLPRDVVSPSTSATGLQAKYFLPLLPGCNISGWLMKLMKKRSGLLQKKKRPKSQSSRGHTSIFVHKPGTTTSLKFFVLSLANQLIDILPRNLYHNNSSALNYS